MSAEDEILKKAIDVGAELLPDLIRWSADRLRGGSDPKLELRAMMAAGDVVVDAYEDAVLGPAK